MTEYNLPAEEQKRLRKLAQKQMEIANLPIQEKRRKIWTAMNDAVPGARPPFAIESNTFDRDFMPENIFQCKTEFGRKWETNLLRAIRHHELIGDDHVCPDNLTVRWHLILDEFGIEIPTEYIKDENGIETGYHFDCPIKDLADDGYAMVKPSTFDIDRESTMLEAGYLQEILGDIMPVEIKAGNSYTTNNLTQRLMRLMSMETFFMAMYDAPEELHGLMSILRDNAINRAKWAEREGLLYVNNENDCTCETCYNFTNLLPKREIGNDIVRLSDMWGVMDSQETVGVSPELFNEFVFPYYKTLADQYGLVYWGCCEPADPIWETSLQHLPNLKAVSISRWADQNFMAEKLHNTGIVFSRKPDPNILGVGEKLNENHWRNEIKTTLDIVTAKNIPFEFIVRDVYSLSGDLTKVKRATEIVREEVDKVYGSL